MPGLMGIDIETYSSAPLPRCGVYRYCDAPDFEILLFSYAFDDEPVQTIDLASGETLPKEVISALEDPGIIKVAYNAQFERVCLSRYLGHWLDPRQWRCTMVMAAYLTLPGQAWRTPPSPWARRRRRWRKAKTSSATSPSPASPPRPTAAGRETCLPHAPEKWAVYRQYNAQDVETERAIRKALEKYPLPEQEWELYALDQQINDRGVRVDKKLVKNAMAVDAVFAQAACSSGQRSLTGLENPGSVNQLKAWLADHGHAHGEPRPRRIVQEKAAQTDGIVAELLEPAAGAEQNQRQEVRGHGSLRVQGRARTWPFAILWRRNAHRSDGQAASCKHKTSLRTICPICDLAQGDRENAAMKNCWIRSSPPFPVRSRS